MCSLFPTSLIRMTIPGIPGIRSFTKGEWWEIPAPWNSTADRPGSMPERLLSTANNTSSSDRWISTKCQGVHHPNPTQTALSFSHIGVVGLFSSFPLPLPFLPFLPFAASSSSSLETGLQSNTLVHAESDAITGCPSFFGCFLIFERSQPTSWPVWIERRSTCYF